MNRRTLLAAAFGLWANGARPDWPAPERMAVVSGSGVRPRYVLCLLSNDDLSHLSEAATKAIDTFATGFSVDRTYSQNTPDPHMARSFEVCWDRVVPGAWTRSDEQAVAGCRLAFAKRPLVSDSFFESGGFHLVGLPEVYVSRSRGNERKAVRLMDEIADELEQRGLEPTVKDRNLTLSNSSTYPEDDFKYNPFGIVLVGA